MEARRRDGHGRPVRPHRNTGEIVSPVGSGGPVDAIGRQDISGTKGVPPPEAIARSPLLSVRHPANRR
jgi:hypothetical protein